MLYSIALQMLPRVSGTMTKRLLSYCGSPEEVFKASKKKILSIPNVGPLIYAGIANAQVLHRAEQELKFIERNGIDVRIYTDINYPKRLLECEDCPYILYSRGKLSLDSPKVISIVGTRNATSYSQALCEKIFAGLKEKGYQPIIVSGLAYGVDIIAHKHALAHAFPTVAVFGTGLNRTYPAAHHQIAEQIAQNGLLLSEFTSDASIVPGNFLSRNRIIAGLSDATLVLESSSKGGALVTACIAQSYNRDVLACPGRVGDPYSEGCNSLIKKQVAALVENVDDIEYALGWSNTQTKPQQMELFADLTEEEQVIINQLKHKDSETMDQLSYTTGLPMAKLSSLLLQLEFAGQVRSLPGKAYSLKRI